MNNYNYVIGGVLIVVFTMGLFSGMLLEQSDDWEKAQLNFDRGINYSMRYDLKETYFSKYIKCEEDRIFESTQIVIDCDKIDIFGNITYADIKLLDKPGKECGDFIGISCDAFVSDPEQEEIQ